MLLAKNLQGYRNLCKISSSGYLRDDYNPNGKPIVEWSTIEQYHKGLICLSGCIGGELAQTILNSKNADKILLRHQSLFGEDYYIEIQRHETHKENACSETFGLQKQVEPVLLASSILGGVEHLTPRVTRARRASSRRNGRSGFRLGGLSCHKPLAIERKRSSCCYRSFRVLLPSVLKQVFPSEI